MERVVTRVTPGDHLAGAGYRTADSPGGAVTGRRPESTVDSGRRPASSRPTAPRKETETVKVHVDPDRCQGHTLCAMSAPKVFELSDIDGHASPALDQVPVDQEENAREAVRSCPERAISLSE